MKKHIIILADVDESGIGVEKDVIKAFEYYKESAEKGVGCAQNHLAALYGEGEGTEKDLKKAFYWYNQAMKKHIIILADVMNRG